jgi:hypothetical protein
MLQDVMNEVSFVEGVDTNLIPLHPVDVFAEMNVILLVSVPFAKRRP